MACASARHGGDRACSGSAVSPFLDQGRRAAPDAAVCARARGDGAMSARRLLVAIALLAAAPMAGAATRWNADASASRLVFTATQAGARFDGQFKKFTPQITFDPANLGGSRFVVDVVTGSADTQDKDRDETLASDDFFATGRWPSAHFETTSFTARSDGQ